MSQNKERIQILSDVRRGALETSEAITLLQELSARPESSHAEFDPNESNRELRILRTDLENNKTLMDIRLPINLLNAAERVGANLQPYLKLIQAEQFQTALATPGIHRLIDQILPDTNEHLQIFLD